MSSLKLAPDYFINDIIFLKTIISSRKATRDYKKAMGKGIPYQTLISGMIHQYIEGDLVEKKAG